MLSTLKAQQRDMSFTLHFCASLGLRRTKVKRSEPTCHIVTLQMSLHNRFGTKDRMLHTFVALRGRTESNYTFENLCFARSVHA